MKTSLRTLLSMAAIATGLAFTPSAQGDSSAGHVEFGDFKPSSSGGEFVEVNVQSNLISMAARLFSKTEPTVADLLTGLHGIRVNVIGLNDDNRSAVHERISDIRKSLAGKGWDQVVTAKEGSDDVAVFVKLRGEEAIEGVVVTVLDGKNEAVFVNIVGDIRPEKIAIIAEKLNIEPLQKISKAINGQ